MTNQIRNDEALRKIGAKLKTLREAVGKQQREVLAETGIHIAAIETARYNISVSTLDRLCRYYGLTFVEFLNDIDL